MNYDPFWLFRAPLSGDVAGKIVAPWFSPALTVNYAGNAVIEDRVVHEVASYGKQLGWLNDVVLALAARADLPADVDRTVEQLSEAARRIEAIKRTQRQDALTAAIDSLDRLRQEHPQAHDELLCTRGRSSS